MREKLSQGRVTAPRVLGVRKVVNYVVQKLGSGRNGSRAGGFGGHTVRRRGLRSRDVARTVKEFLWRKGTDVELVYRFKDGVDYGGTGGGRRGNSLTAFIRRPVEDERV